MLPLSSIPKAAQIERVEELQPVLEAEIRRLRNWADVRLDELEDKIQAETRAARKASLEQQQVDVETLLDERTTWFNETMSTEDQPYLRLAAVLFQGSRSPWAALWPR